MLVIATEIDREIERAEDGEASNKNGSYHVCCQNDIPMCALLLIIFFCLFRPIDIDAAASLIRCVKSWHTAHISLTATIVAVCKLASSPHTLFYWNV